MTKIFKKKKSLIILLVLYISLAMIGFTACSTNDTTGESGKDKIVFADAQWESIQFHNAVAQTIIEKGYGYPTDVISGSTAATFTGFTNGEIDVYMEVWIQNVQERYDEAIKNGDIIKTSTNFDDNAQGLYVPTYVIKGDPDRGIEPMAPDLKTVKDLAKYPELFKDEEDPSKGRIYGGPPGWEVDQILRTKVETYGLDEQFNYFSPGSDSGLAASLAAAYESGEAWVGYYWEPTWVTGKYDFTLLEDEPYDEAKWEDGYATEWPAVDVAVAVYKDMPEKAPKVVEFLEKYKTSSDITSEALAYMQDNNTTAEEAGLWFLREKEDIWTQWVSEDIAQKVKEAIQ
ncbi:ABC transporter substrate-binding protein [Irregularibacter muris]|uniref:ABC transporter substrate-binding protein n=1 Tax=Irregularibacter muris TaxID=1796619 RepID=A0AAE3HFJ6_9FIRM|nr:ABC transporter substrate-binding protein [Irregularibacter muris]MCR1897668.1 ABC transporter substrate-binding protein [Irregularibacter muris]